MRALLVSSLLLFVCACAGSDCVRLSDGTCKGSGAQGADTNTPDGGSTSSEGGGVSGFEAYGVTPSGGHISLDCTPNQIPGFAAHDCLYSHYQDPQTVKCTLKMADRLGVVIGVATPVSFMAEAGDITPVVVSPAFPAGPDALGHADGYLEVFGAPLPADVAPLAGEVSASVDFGCGVRTANPRDGYVTVIAWVRGEEGFVDVNQNGKYDPGEPFVDMGEPFVDANDNGKWDPGEWYLDVDGSGNYTEPNGKWDADTILWTQTRVVYTGLPAFAVDTSSRNTLARIYEFGGATPPAPIPAPTPFSVRVGPPTTSALYGVFFTDALLNPLDPSASYSVAPTSGSVQASLTTPVLPLRPPPAAFRLLYCDKPMFPATCHDGPVESGCRTSPCYVVPEVGLCLTAGCSGFAYGTYADLTITGSKVGSDIVWVSANVAGVTTSFSIVGQCTP